MNITGNKHAENLQQIIQLDQEFFPEPWTDTQWKTLNWDLSALFPFKDNNGIVLGFALFGVVPGDDTSHLYKILVHPSRQGTQEVQAFWSDILEQLKGSGIRHIYLEVNSNNQKAIGFYRKQSFKLVRQNKGHYSNGDDALIMTLTL